MRTYVKIEGENIEPIVQKLAKLAVDSPEICVLDINILDMGYVGVGEGVARRDMESYFGVEPDVYEKHCDRIISKSGAELGDAQIYFEWLMPPSDDQLRELRDLINEVLKPYGNKFNVVNKE